MHFWRINNNKLHFVSEVDHLGWQEGDHYVIQDKYLNEKKFFVFRTCHGLGDWGIISAMPRLLKEKYPDCKVYVPSKKMIENIFDEPYANFYKNSWLDPYSNAEIIFRNNPHVDGFLDYYEGEIFHDHYRIYKKENEEVPLIKQMLKFWQFSESEMDDCQPEIYWTDKEIELGDNIINNLAIKQFNSILISNRYNEERDFRKIKSLIEEHKCKNYITWFPNIDIKNKFDFVNDVFSLRHVNIRVQLYIRSKARVNIGNQCGILDILPRYTNVIEIKREESVRENKVNGVLYI